MEQKMWFGLILGWLAILKKKVWVDYEQLLWMFFSSFQVQFFFQLFWKCCSVGTEKWLFEIIHIFRFEIWDLRSRDLKIFLGYDINYLSIWPFRCHPWFPTRKSSKLAFVCFQLQLFSSCIMLNNWRWKQINISLALSGLYRCISKLLNWIILEVQWQIVKIIFVLAP